MGECHNISDYSNTELKGQISTKWVDIDWFTDFLRLLGIFYDDDQMNLKDSA